MKNETLNNHCTATDGKPPVSGSDSFKSCQNCKFYTADKNRCNHEYWSLCIIRDDDGYVKSYAYHHLR